MARPADDHASALARRLRELREQYWKGIHLTQGQLAEALGVSTGLISSWEQSKATPPVHRLAAYAAFFATRRSVSSKPYRLLRASDLTAEEEAQRESLDAELQSLRDATYSRGHASDRIVTSPLGGSWWFRDGNPVTIACSELPPEQLALARDPEHSTLAYGELYSFGDIDALLEIYGHIRAANPTSKVFVRKASELRQGDYANHLVALGGVDWNALTRSTLARLSPSIRQVSPGDDPKDAYFELDDGDTQRFYAKLGGEGELLSDIGLLVRAPSPFDAGRTITVCSAMYSLGVRGMVTALTDERVRARNETYLSEEFSGGDAFAILSYIPVVGDRAVAPDWTQEEIILRRWAPKN